MLLISDINYMLGLHQLQVTTHNSSEPLYQKGGSVDMVRLASCKPAGISNPDMKSSPKITAPAASAPAPTPIAKPGPGPPRPGGAAADDDGIFK